MTRWRWYFDSADGWREFERELEAGLPWACILIALVAVLIVMGRQG